MFEPDYYGIGIRRIRNYVHRTKKNKYVIQIIHVHEPPEIFIHRTFDFPIIRNAFGVNIDCTKYIKISSPDSIKNRRTIFCTMPFFQKSFCRAFKYFHNYKINFDFPFSEKTNELLMKCLTEHSELKMHRFYATYITMTCIHNELPLTHKNEKKQKCPLFNKFEGQRNDETYVHDNTNDFVPEYKIFKSTPEYIEYNKKYKSKYVHRMPQISNPCVDISLINTYQGSTVKSSILTSLHIIHGGISVSRSKNTPPKLSRQCFNFDSDMCGNDFDFYFKKILNVNIIMVMNQHTLNCFQKLL